MYDIQSMMLEFVGFVNFTAGLKVNYTLLETEIHKTYCYILVWLQHEFRRGDGYSYNYQASAMTLLLNLAYLYCLVSHNEYCKRRNGFIVRMYKCI